MELKRQPGEYILGNFVLKKKGYYFVLLNKGYNLDLDHLEGNLYQPVVPLYLPVLLLSLAQRGLQCDTDRSSVGEKRIEVFIYSRTQYLNFLVCPVGW